MFSKKQKQQLRGFANSKTGKIVGKVGVQAARQGANRLPPGAREAAMFGISQGSSAAKKQLRPDSNTKKIRGSGTYFVDDGIPGNATFGPDTVALKMSTPSASKFDLVMDSHEYVMDLNVPASPANFNVIRIPINPGLSGFAKRLSQIAQNFEKYFVYRLILAYEPQTSANSSSPSLGSLAIVHCTNPGRANFQSELELCDYENAICKNVASPFRCGVECDPSRGGEDDMLLTRGTTVPSGEDIKTYDLGFFQIAISGLNPAVYTAGTRLGKLRMYYKIGLSTPKLYSSLGYAQLSEMYRGTTGITVTEPMGTAPRKCKSNNIGTTWQNTGAYSRIIFPDDFQGSIAVTMSLESSVAATLYTAGAGQGTMSMTGNVVPLSFGYNASGATSGMRACYGNFQNNATSPTRFLSVFYWTVSPALTPGGNFIDFSGAGGSAFTSFFISICTINPNVGKDTDYTPA
jgi:hypothetical protein